MNTNSHHQPVSKSKTLYTSGGVEASKWKVKVVIFQEKTIIHVPTITIMV
jgi:hypothetical protein